MRTEKNKITYNKTIGKQKQRLVSVITAVMFLFFLFVPNCEISQSENNSLSCDDVCVSGVCPIKASCAFRFDSKALDASAIKEKSFFVPYASFNGFAKKNYRQPFVKSTESIIPVGKQAPPFSLIFRQDEK